MMSRLAIVLFLLLAASPGFGQTAATPPPPEPGTTPPAAEEATLESFGAENPTCGEWNDGCATCKRTSNGVMHCSTPGIACTPKQLLCAIAPP